MSMLIQQSYTPDCSQISPARLPREYQLPGKMDPLVDRAMALARVGVWRCNLSDESLSWTSGVYDLFGLPIGMAIERRQTVAMYTDESRDAMERLRAQAIARGGSFTFDAQIAPADRSLRWIRITGEMVRGVDGAPLLHGLKQDITEEKQRLDALRRLAENDALTGLASRAVYESRFLNMRRNDPRFLPLGALILFDLDGFKEINDGFGHLAGDACLQVFAERLSANFAEALLIARIGGDEFAVIIGHDVSIASIHARMRRFRARLRAPILWRGHMFTVGATSGMAVPADSHTYDPEELFMRADAALYSAKPSSRRS